MNTSRLIRTYGLRTVLGIIGLIIGLMIGGSIGVAMCGTAFGLYLWIFTGSVGFTLGGLLGYFVPYNKKEKEYKKPSE